MKKLNARINKAINEITSKPGIIDISKEEIEKLISRSKEITTAPKKKKAKATIVYLLAAKDTRLDKFGELGEKYGLCKNLYWGARVTKNLWKEKTITLYFY